METSKILGGSQNDFLQELNTILTHLENTIAKYNKLNNGQLHWSMKISLNQLTVKSLIPFAAAKITQLRRNRKINPVVNGSDDELAFFLIFGIHGILHEKPFNEISSEELKHKKEIIFRLVYSVLGMDEKGESL